MSLYRDYMNALLQRKEQLDALEPSGLVAMMLNLESVFLYELERPREGFHGRDMDVEEDREDLVSELRDFVRYEKTKERVASQIDDAFTPETPEVRDHLIETITHMVIRISE